MISINALSKGLKKQMKRQPARLALHLSNRFVFIKTPGKSVRPKQIRSQPHNILFYIGLDGGTAGPALPAQCGDDLR